MVTAKRCIVPYRISPDKDVEEFTKELKEQFGDKIDIINKTVGKFHKSTGNIYMHKKYVGKIATIIVWNEKDNIFKKRGEYK